MLKGEAEEELPTMPLPEARGDWEANRPELEAEMLPEKETEAEAEALGGAEGVGGTTCTAPDTGAAAAKTLLPF